MKKLAILFMAGAATLSAMATDGDFDFKFYGRVRADLFYNSRANEETVDGLFYMYPKDHNYDADGNDLNASPEGSMYSLYTRLGVDIKGPKVGSADASAKVEVDFRGNGTNYSLLRIRHAYINLDWGKSAVRVGQSWHPLTGDVMPNTLNVNTGAPFQPFNRSPQVRYRYTDSQLQLTAAAVWQMQYASAGPQGKSHTYLKQGCVPELFAGIDYVGSHFRAGVGAEVLSLVPRRTATVGGKTYKVDERVTTLSAEAHAQYKKDLLTVAAKTTLGNNLTQCSMVGGFGVTDTDPATGECKYAPIRTSATWLNVVYGKKWQPGVFVGYMKNLGTGKEMQGTFYGVGTNVDEIFEASAQLSYNLPHWKMGVELTTCTAAYGSWNLKDGTLTDTHSVNNLRALVTMMYIF